MLHSFPHRAGPGRVLRRGLMAVVVLALALPMTLVFGRTYTVEDGDTLSSIADAHGVSADELAALNGIEDRDFIWAGQSLVLDQGVPAEVPASGRVHIVEAGDTLSLIADAYGATLEELLALNGLEDPNVVYEGQWLSLPVSDEAARPVSRAEAEVILRSAAYEFGVPESLILGLAWLESGWNQSLVSWAGATGVMQLMPETADWGLEYLAPDASNWESSTEDNARLGTAIFAQMLAQAGWDTELALAFYYQGWRSIELYGIFDETHNYVENVLSLAAEYE